jgi:hypothetical protein
VLWTWVEQTARQRHDEEHITTFTHEIYIVPWVWVVQTAVMRNISLHLHMKFFREKKLLQMQLHVEKYMIINIQTGFGNMQIGTWKNWLKLGKY